VRCIVRTLIAYELEPRGRVGTVIHRQMSRVRADFSFPCVISRDDLNPWARRRARTVVSPLLHEVIVRLVLWLLKCLDEVGN